MMQQEVFWENPYYRKKPRLTEDISCAWLIVGGGITGISVAYFLRKRGIRDIAVVEKNTVASGATGRAAGMFVLGMEHTDFRPFLKKYGRKNLEAYWAAQIAALHSFQHIVREEKIHCEMDREPTYFVAKRKENVQWLEKEYRAFRNIYRSAQLLANKEIDRELGIKIFQKGEKVHWAFGLNPLQYTQNLSNVLVKQGIKIYEHTPMLRERNGIAATPGGNIRFQHIIYAVDAFYPRDAIQKIKTTIAVTSPIPKSAMKKLHLKPEMFYDHEARDYHYARLMENRRLLMGYGGVRLEKLEDPVKLHAPDVRNVRRLIRRAFPSLHLKIEYAWSGIMGLPKTDLPIVRFGKRRVFILGSGSQIFSIMLARYAVNRLLGKKQRLDRLFKS